MRTAAVNERLGKVGIWSMELRFGDRAEIDRSVAELDELGYGAVWIPGGIDDQVLGDVSRLLSVTKKTVIATGILNIWKHQPADVANWFKGVPDAQKERVMIGIGVSHGPLIGDAWKKPIEVTRDFVERLAAAGMPADNMCIAALGPKMLKLSGELTAGTHPYLVTPEHSAVAREILGPGKLVAPEQGVILESDPARARELALAALTHYRQLPNYLNNWRRLGFSEAEITNADDRLIDGLFAWGGAGKIAERVRAHHAKGADHVCMQVVHGTPGDYDALRGYWRELASAVL
jgi:probable F420-dependent oxidoreductase